MFVQYKDINTLVLDSGVDTTDEEIQKASVILLVYDVTVQDTKHRLDQYWLPKISEINEEIPVILVGNKVDMRPIHFENDLESLITPLVMKYKQVEMGIECSAKAYLKLIDVIFCAQRAVLFPIAPLQDPITKELTTDYEKALLRIFRICDRDCDGYLDDGEIWDMQASVFNGDLQPCHIEGLKEFLRQTCHSEKYSREDAQKGINFEAFKCLNTIFIKRMKLQTSWMILEHYGYNEKLRISEEYLVSNEIKEDELNQKWEGIELSSITEEYLLRLFGNHWTSEGYLTESGIDEIFQTTIEGCPWDIPNEAKILNENCIDRTTWINLWQKALFEDYEKAFELLVYLGFCDQFYNAVEIKTGRERYLLSESKKTVLNCFVVGGDKVGKSSFLEMFLKENLQDEIYDPDKDRSIVASVEVNNKIKTLILTEFHTPSISEQLLNNKKRANYCDVFCLMHDGSEKSAKFLNEIHPKLPKRIPKVIIRTKADVAARVGNVSTEELANELRTSQYIEISNKNIAQVKEAVGLLTQTALFPIKGLEHNIVEVLKEEIAKQKKKKQQMYAYSAIGAVVVVGGCIFAAKPVWTHLKKFFIH